MYPSHHLPTATTSRRIRFAPKGFILNTHGEPFFFLFHLTCCLSFFVSGQQCLMEFNNSNSITGYTWCKCSFVQSNRLNWHITTEIIYHLFAARLVSRVPLKSRLQGHINVECKCAWMMWSSKKICFPKQSYWKELINCSGCRINNEFQECSGCRSLSKLRLIQTILLSQRSRPTWR